MIPPDAIGWAASALMLLTFSCERAAPLRCCAIAANLAFITYGWVAGIPPVMALHLLLLPINVFRLSREVRMR